MCECAAAPDERAGAYGRTRSVKLSRTIAGLAGVAQIQATHVAEAIQYGPRRQF